ncbi:MAG TPA: hypothetical protein VI365_22460 [Trebonia sp.]
MPTTVMGQAPAARDCAFRPGLVDALSAITTDDLGKSALREGPSKVVIRNTGEFFSAAGISFADGVLTFDHNPHTNIDQGEERCEGPAAALESAL